MASIATLTKEIERLEKENQLLKIRLENHLLQVKYINSAIRLMSMADNHFKHVMIEDMEKHIKEY